MKFSIISLFFFFLLHEGFSQSKAVGFVFEDTNGNGRKDRNEKGLPNIAVSNGYDVVLSDKNGRYELSVGDDNIIFVVKPSGYMTQVNEKNLPQYYYIHKPYGSPELMYPGTPPTGKLPKLINFPLTPTSEEDDFRILVFGDPQPRNLQELAYFEKAIVSELTGVNNVKLGISLGDLVFDNLDLFNPYIDVTSNIGVPWYNVMGNHDMNFDAKADSLSDETFEAHFGPANYSFNVGKVHFIVLDNILYPDPRGQRQYWGGFREDQKRFVENNLKFVPKDHLIVVALHIPISEEDSDTFRDEDRQWLFDVLKGFPNTLSLSAHTHLQKHDFFTKEDGWRQEKPHHHFNIGTTSGDWYSGKLIGSGLPMATMRDGTPQGYAFINFSGNKYTIDYKVAGKPDDYQIQIFSPKVVGYRSRTSAGIFANFFMGTSQDDVKYRINNGKWNEMTKVEDYDPSYLVMVFEWDLTEVLLPGRRPSNPRASKHLWRARLPTDLDPGIQTIEVKAVDMFGREFIQKHTYKILPVDVQ